MALQAVIAPSILSADFGNLGAECNRMLDAGADWLHVDIMDGHFVPNISIGVPVVASLRKNLPAAFLDCHLMVEEPLKWVEPFARAGASGFTFHYEAAKDPGAVMAAIKEAGIQAGVALRPRTLLEHADGGGETLLQFLEKEYKQGRLDMVLVMTVEPGFGGQSFMADMMDKVRTLRGRFPGLYIEVDGGLSPETVRTAANAGANVIVAGNALFKSADAKQTINLLRSGVVQAQH